MKTYIVTIQEVHSVNVKVSAKNGKEARELAAKLVNDEKIDYSELAYSHHLPQKDWPTVVADEN